MKTHSKHSLRIRPLLAALLCVGGAAQAQLQTDMACPSVVNEQQFANAAQLRQMMSTVVGFGSLRSAGSQAGEQTIDWLAGEFRKIPGMTVRTEAFDIERWQPSPQNPQGPGRSLELAAQLQVTNKGVTQAVPVGGAMPFSLPTGAAGQAGAMVFLPADVAITPENARGKIVIRDVPRKSIPFIGLALLAYHLTPDLLPQVLSSYDRPFLSTDGPLSEDMIAAGQAGAVGYVSVFNVPRDQIRGYFDPHWGTHYKLPALFVGVDEGVALKKLAAEGAQAQLTVLAERDASGTRNLYATLPGGSAERVVINTNTDGIGWVQENGTVGLLALAKYFASLPMQCRPRTLEFALGSGHLHMSREGNHAIAKQLDRDYGNGSVAYAMVLEHLGTREILPASRWPAPGKTLKFTGKGEPAIWATGTPVLARATVDAVKRRQVDRTAVSRGLDLPSSAHVPPICGFGGIGGYFNSFLVPVVSTISGPWSLWAPSFGEAAVDFERMRKQLLVAGDIVLASGKASRNDIAGDYMKYRQQRAGGAAGCTALLDLPPQEAPAAAP